MGEFESLSVARRLTKQWQDDDNDRRPRSALGDVRPNEFATRCAAFALAVEGLRSSGTANLPNPILITTATDIQCRSPLSVQHIAILQ